MITYTRKIFILLIIFSPLIAMEQPAFTDELSFITKDGRSIRCALLRATSDAIAGADSDPSLLPEESVEPELLAASPQSFVKFARERFDQYIEDIMTEKGITPQMIADQMDQAQKDLYKAIRNTRYERPTTQLVREIESVAQEMGVAKPLLKKRRNGDAMAAKADVVEYDPHALKKLAPTPRRRKAGWAHELSHNDAKDTQREVALIRALHVTQKVDVYSPNTKDTVNRVAETFADLAPASRSREYAVHFERLWKRQMQMKGNPVASSHPSDEHRRNLARLMTQFHDEYAQEQKRKEAFEQAQSKISDSEKENVFNRNVRRNLLEAFEKVAEEEETVDM